MISLSVIVPAYNEITTIEQILTRIREQKIQSIDIEIVVVDDGSTDGTRQFLAENPNLYDILLENPQNLGKGGAIKRALEASTGEYILFQDADLEYDPAEYGKLVFPVLNFQADVVMGSRFLAPNWTRIFYFWHKVGNGLITNWFNLLYNTTWTDVYSCYLMFRSNLLRPDELRTVGWEQHAEILGKVCLRGNRCYEVPISYDGRSYDDGKKIRWYHMLPVLSTMMRVRLTK